MAAAISHTTSDDAARVAPAGDVDAASWQDANARGLAYAADASWNAARNEFERAIAALTVDAAPDVTTHDALALVLGNLAHACFRAGQLDDAIRHAQRGCALRVALVGEDAVTVARARSDLAVMLAAAGRVEEAPALLARSIAGIEQSAGDEDARLAIVLENAARVALATGQPASAEPYLIRLHALLAAHDMPTDAADALVSRIMTARSTAQTVRESVSAVAEQMDSAQVDSAQVDSVQVDSVQVDSVQVDSVQVDSVQVDSRQVEAEQPEPVMLAEQMDDDEWDDQPLRDAVVLTDTLLRTTPSGNVAVRPDADAHDPWTSDAEETATAEATDRADAFADPFAEQELELADLDFLSVTDARDSVPTASDVAAPPPAAPAPGNGLGFIVEYGIPRDTAPQPAIPHHSYEPPAIRGSDAITRDAQDQSASFDPNEDGNVDLLTPPGAIPSLGFEAELDLVPEQSASAQDEVAPDSAAAAASQAPQSAAASPAPASADASTPTHGERRKTPRHVSVVMPSPAGGVPTVQTTMTDRDDLDDAPHASATRTNTTGTNTTGTGGPGTNAPGTNAARPTVHNMPAVGAPPAPNTAGETPAQPAGTRGAPRVGSRMAKAEPEKKSNGLAIGGAVAAIVAAAAGWFFMRGGM